MLYVTTTEEAADTNALGARLAGFLSGFGSGSTPTGLYGFKDFRVIYSQKKKKRKLL
jgi:hypothetical protein